MTEVRRTREIEALKEHCRSSDAEIRTLQKQFDAERAELVHQAATGRQARLTRFETSEAQWLREIEETREFTKERAFEIKPIRAELSSVVQQRDRLHQEVTSMTTRRTGNHGSVRNFVCDGTAL